MFTNDKTESKLLILAISKVFDEEIEFDIAAKIILNCLKISNMDFLGCITELCDSGLAEIRNENGVKLFALTEQGENVASEAVNSLRYIDIPALLKSAEREYERVALGREYTANLLESEDGEGCFIEFSYKLKGKKMCGFSAFYENFDVAEKALEKIQADPSYFRRYIMTYLNGN